MLVAAIVDSVCGGVLAVAIAQIRREGLGDSRLLGEDKVVCRGERRVERRVTSQMASTIIAMQFQDGHFRSGSSKTDIELGQTHNGDGTDDRDDRRGNPSPFHSAHQPKDAPVHRDQKGKVDHEHFKDKTS